ncbi:MAG: glycerophosphodiester phosphodiesterase family protein, partial [Gemmatimonadetes bacterium]|nr:glycerophosphodiester phosphodiesterase family protein [Gemmatimonadota bacterium]
MIAFQKALEIGVDEIELDLHSTRDGHLVVMHDADVDRTTDGTGAVAELTLAEIKALDAGSSYGGQFRDERVPTWEEALDLVQGKVGLNVHLKEG